MVEVVDWQEHGSELGTREDWWPFIGGWRFHMESQCMPRGGGSGRGQQRRTAARAARAGGAGPGLARTATQHMACGDFKASQSDPVLEARGLGKARGLRMRSGGPGCRGQARPEHQGAGRPEILQSTPVSPRFSSKI
jgi:hypothetical protein